MNKEETDNLRKAMGTLPSQRPKKNYKIVRGVSELEVDMYDYPLNPYKTICECVTATWGDDKYESKWDKLTPQNRFRLVLAVLTGNTLPTVLESIQFSFKVVGLPRHAFDQHARARIGTTFFSIGSRDNNKLDSRYILYTKLYDKFKSDESFMKLLTDIKDIEVLE